LASQTELTKIEAKKKSIQKTWLDKPDKNQKAQQREEIRNNT
jgi:hypothetical protein